MGDRRTFCGVLLVCALSTHFIAAQELRTLTDNRAGSWDEGSLDATGNIAWLASNVDPATGELLADREIVEWDLLADTTTILSDLGEPVERLDASDDGNWFLFVSRGDLTGSNPDYGQELFVVHRDGTGLAQISAGTQNDGFSFQHFDLAGSGNKVVFFSRGNPLSLNPLNVNQLFIADRDGSNLAQLTQWLNVGEGSLGLSISDDGQRIVFSADANPTGGNQDGTAEIFAIAADGTGLTQLTANLNVQSIHPVISGDGTTVVFQEDEPAAGPPPLPSPDVFHLQKINWDGTGSARVTPVGQEAYDARVTDDGLVAFYAVGAALSDREVWRIDTDGTGATQLTSGTDRSRPLAAAGNGSRVLITTLGPIPGLTIDGTAAVVMDDDGTDPTELTELFGFTFGGQADVTADGSKVVIMQGGLYLFDTQGSPGDPATVLSGIPRSNNTQITDDGGTIVFQSWDDPLGTNPSGRELFAIESDGTGLRQLTDSGADPSSSATPALVGDGSWIVFQSSTDLAGTNPDESAELYRIRPDGTSVAQITDDDDGLFKLPRVDEAGVWIVYQSQGDPLGQNGDGSSEIFRIRSDGSGLEQITDGGANQPDISGAGDRIVFHSSTNFLASNPDGNSEIFLYEPSTTTLTQLTSSTDGDNWQPRISADGSFAYFQSDATLFDPVPDGDFEPYRVRISDGRIERVGGLRDPSRGGLKAGWEDGQPVVPTADGRRAVFHAAGARSSANFDGSSEMWWADYDASPSLDVSKQTVVRWIAEPGPVSYDVIRGNVDDLQVLPDDTVDLGSTICVEDDSDDDVSDEDTALPPVGQVFFYAYRGTQGGGDGPGSYGRSSAGQERVTGAGCAP